jgi:hypothetical protein
MQDANLFIEKRAHPRVPVKIPVKYRLVEDLKGIQSIIEIRKTVTNTESLDLSLGGIYIVAEQKLEPGHILSLDIFLPKKERPLSAFAEVVWSKESGAGLHFMLLKNEDLVALTAFLDDANPAKTDKKS